MAAQRPLTSSSLGVVLCCVLCFASIPVVSKQLCLSRNPALAEKPASLYIPISSLGRLPLRPKADSKGYGAPTRDLLPV